MWQANILLHVECKMPMKLHCHHNNVRCFVSCVVEKIPKQMAI